MNKTVTAKARTYTVVIGTPDFTVRESLYKELIALANLRSDDSRAIDRFFKAIAPTERTPEREFLALNSPARLLLVDAFTDLVRDGFLSTKVENRINKLLAETPFKGSYYLKGSEVRSNARISAPSLEHMAAYGITALVGSNLHGCVLQCRLSECQKYFWAPKKRGPRPSYCSERHRVTGAQRESRGLKP